MADRVKLNRIEIRKTYNSYYIVSVDRTITYEDANVDYENEEYGYSTAEEAMAMVKRVLGVN